MAKSERKEAWFRIIVAIISGIVFYFWGIVICIVALLNWIVVVFSGERQKGLAEFCEQYNTEFYRFLRYLTFMDNERPFPFTSTVGRISKFNKQL